MWLHPRQRRPGRLPRQPAKPTPCRGLIERPMWVYPRRRPTSALPGHHWRRVGPMWLYPQPGLASPVPSRDRWWFGPMGSSKTETCKRPAGPKCGVESIGSGAEVAHHGPHRQGHECGHDRIGAQPGGPQHLHGRHGHQPGGDERRAPPRPRAARALRRLALALPRAALFFCSAVRLSLRY